MDIKFWTPVLVSTVLAAGSVQTMADSSWGYDEDSQTIIYPYSGSPTQSSSHTDDDVMKQSGSLHYDEVNDWIVYHSEGSRDRYVRSNPSNEPVFDFELAYLDQ